MPTNFDVRFNNNHFPNNNPQSNWAPQPQRKPQPPTAVVYNTNSPRKVYNSNNNIVVSVHNKLSQQQPIVKKEPPKEPVKQPATAPPAKQPAASQPAKKPVNVPAREPVKEPAKILSWTPLSKEKMIPHPIAQLELMLGPRTPQRARSEENLLAASTDPEESYTPEKNKPEEQPRERIIMDIGKQSRCVQTRLKLNPLSDNKVSKTDDGSLDSGLAMEKDSQREDLTKSQENLSAVPLDDNTTIAKRLYEVLSKYRGGVIEKFLPEVFQKSTGSKLADHWPTLINSFSGYFTVESSSLGHVVYANEIIEPVEKDHKLTLPWLKPQWNVFITNIQSTTMVWGRIIGPEYSNKWDDLVTEIEYWLKLKGEEQKPVAVKMHEFYLCIQDSCVHRVRCEEVDLENKRFMGFFIDTGHQEWLSIDAAIFCDEKFLALPGQALQFSLSGLEALEEDPHAKDVLEGALLEQTVVADIKTKAEDNEEDAAIPVVLYDTSTQDDVNLNLEIAENIVDAVAPPQFNAKGYTKVKVTHVTNNGVVYCQVSDSGVEFVEKMIDKLVMDKDTLSMHQGLYKSVPVQTTTVAQYLIHSGGSWQRGVLRMRTNNDPSGVHDVHCIDTGREVSVKESAIYRLVDMSRILSKYPALAIRCHLHSVTLSPSTVERIRELLLGKMSLAKLMTNHSTPPAVKLYQQLEKNRIIVCINETLQMEYDLESNFENIAV